MTTRIGMLFLMALTCASPADAACVDQGLPAFDDSAYRVTICDAESCLSAIERRSCGNVHYASQEFERGSEIWLFRIKERDPETETGPKAAIEIRPSNPNEIPLTVLNGRPVRLLVGVPIGQSRAGTITCTPLSAPEACDLINQVLSGLK